MLSSLQIISPVGNVEITYALADRLLIDDVQFSSGVIRVEVNEAQDQVFIHQFVLPGDWYELRPQSNQAGETFSVGVKCFVGPPPPEYRTCPDCGVVTIASGSNIKLNTNKSAFGTRRPFAQRHPPAVELVLNEASPYQQSVRLGIRGEAFQMFEKSTSASKSEYYQMASQAAKLKSFQR